MTSIASLSTPFPLSKKNILLWKTLQVAVFLVGLFIYLSLIFFPTLGIQLFWNFLIPVAPALLVLSPGLWRNICPLAYVALLPRKMGFSARNRLSIRWGEGLQIISLAGLLLIVPFRHLSLDTSGPATAVVLTALGLMALGMGFLFEWKSGWCSALCPVHPVEKLYGFSPALSVPNAQCTSCQNCVIPCPDSTPGVHPFSGAKGSFRKLGATLLVGGFPGFIGGWFFVADCTGPLTLPLILKGYTLPFIGSLITLILFVALRKMLPSEREDRLIQVFATAAVSTYYWFRLPALFGFGPIPGDGMLLDLRGTLPFWFPYLSGLLTTSFFVGWMLLRPQKGRSWAFRPPFGNGRTVRVEPVRAKNK